MFSRSSAARSSDFTYYLHDIISCEAHSYRCPRTKINIDLEIKVLDLLMRMETRAFNHLTLVSSLYTAVRRLTIM
jgi:hypothetical protein